MKGSLKSYFTSKSKCLAVIVPSFHCIEKIAFSLRWVKKNEKGFFPAISSNYYIGFTSYISSDFALFMWLSEKYLLYQIYLIHLGCLCHSLRCADRQLWIYQLGKWSCSHRISVTSHRPYASSCMLFPPFKSGMSSLLKELLSPPFLILEIQRVSKTFCLWYQPGIFFLSTDIQNSYLYVYW